MPTVSVIEAIRSLYESLEAKHAKIRQILGRDALTTAEKVVYSHLISSTLPSQITRGESVLSLQPDRVAMQDATAQMAILQFMQSNRPQVAVPSTVHCDHLIRGQSGSGEDLERAVQENKEVYEFLRTAAAKFGIGFWKPGSGIIHQVVLEKYAFPGGLMIGTDSHTPNAGGLGMIAIGVGGADAAEVMAGMAWEVKAPKLIGVHLKGKLNGWTSPKDVILYLCGKLTTKGGTNKIVEYFGPGADSISATGKGTITNMGAELGATTSIFPFDDKISAYLKATERADIAELAEKYRHLLRADKAVEENPSAYYDEVIELDLSTLEPYIVGPHSPDKARPLSEFAQEVKAQGFPEDLSAALIGSCTNSSYEDLERAASIARQVQNHGAQSKSYLLITPGSEQVRQTIERDGQLKTFTDIGATVLANACGPCIGNWDRKEMKPGVTNAIITSFNRNFPKRNDGNPQTLSFVASPDIVIALAMAGKTTFNPMKDTLDGGYTLAPPVGPELPQKGFAISYDGFIEPPANSNAVEIQVSPTSNRLQLLAPFQPWDGKDFDNLPILVKTQGQTTTDHISPAGKDWLPLRGHLSGISNNLLLGAVDAATGKPAEPLQIEVNGVIRGASPWAKQAKAYQEDPSIGGSIIVGDENYGEGSSREHAAMSPRLLGVKAVIVRSFARIHETNLKKQGILPLTFSNTSDYAKIDKGDRLSLVNLKNLKQGQPVEGRLTKANDGSTITLQFNHSMTTEQINWFKAGSAMNAVNRPELLKI
ncbi:MAG: aconitate hydratase [Cyanobacteria bacterium]|nr:aconitate hydratase [Cyanobacteriota bacterium]